MGQVIQVNGDYSIKTNPTGTITLDTGLSVGTVRITGNLIVEGTTTTITTDNMVISDNILTLNVGETGNGVSIGHAGILVNRGTLNSAGVLFDEVTKSWQFAYGYDDSSSVYSLTDSRITTRNILTNGSNLTLIADNVGVVQVGSATYEQDVLIYPLANTTFEVESVECLTTVVTVTTVIPHGLAIGDLVDVYAALATSINGIDLVITDVSAYTISYIKVIDNIESRSTSGYIRATQVRANNIVPNMKAVSDYTRTAINTAVSHIARSYEITDSDTKVVVADFLRTGTDSSIEISVDGVLHLGITAGLLSVKEAIVFEKGISGTLNEVELTDTLVIKQRITDPLTLADHTKLYTKPLTSASGTGLHFVNSQGTTGEVISRSRALIYSLIF